MIKRLLILLILVGILISGCVEEKSLSNNYKELSFDDFDKNIELRFKHPVEGFDKYEIYKLIKPQVKAFPGYKYEKIVGHIEAPEYSSESYNEKLQTYEYHVYGLYVNMDGFLEGEEDSYFFYVNFIPENNTYSIDHTSFSLKAVPSQIKKRVWNIVKNDDKVKLFQREHLISKKDYRRVTDEKNIQSINDKYILFILDLCRDVCIPEHPRLQVLVDVYNGVIINREGLWWNNEN